MTSTVGPASEEPLTPSPGSDEASTGGSGVPEALDARVSPFIDGNLSPSFPAGTPGEVSIIAIGPAVSPGGGAGTTVVVVVRNNTSTGVYQIGAASTAKDGSGAITGSGKDQGFTPFIVEPGEIALGYVFFSSGGVTDSAGLDIQITSKTPVSAAGTYITDLDVAGLNDANGHILGALTNSSGHRVGGPVSATVFCFTAEGKPTFTRSGFANADSIVAGGTSSFDVQLASTDDCPVYLVGSQGYGA